MTAHRTDRPDLPAEIDAYRLLRRLGTGGTGIVFAAEDTARRQAVAIKLIPGTHRPSEACLALEVRHPNVIALYDAGRYSGGDYLVMELAAGGSVESLLRDRPLPWRRATAILIAACEAVMALHARGILHRDIKPANLLRSAEGTVKLADFGLACRLDSRRSAYSRRPTGTPHYMSPEQCRAEPCDERTDIYSLGATYHTLLTRSTPYAGGLALRILFDHCSAPPPDPRHVRRSIPAACARIVMRAMAKKPADRFDSASEMRDALQATLLGRSAPCPN